MARSLWIILIAVSLCACSGEPTIDTSSPESYKASYDEISKSLEPQDRQKLAQAMLAILGSKASVGGNESPFAVLAAMTALAQNPQAMLDAIGPEIKGKTGKEIIALGEQVRRDRVKTQLQRVNQEIASLEIELRTDRQNADAAKTLLSNIIISNPRYHWDNDGYLPRAIMSFKVENKTGAAIKRIHLHGVLETPGRTIPWVDDDFNYEFPGGLEVAESKDLSLEPNTFSNWGGRSFQDQKDLVLTVRLVNFEGADSKKVISVDAAEIAEKEERLKKLQQDAVELGQKLGSAN